MTERENGTRFQGRIEYQEVVKKCLWMFQAFESRIAVSPRSHLLFCLEQEAKDHPRANIERLEQSIVRGEQALCWMCVPACTQMWSDVAKNDVGGE